MRLAATTSRSRAGGGATTRPRARARVERPGRRERTVDAMMKQPRMVRTARYAVEDSLSSSAQRGGGGVGARAGPAGAVGSTGSQRVVRRAGSRHGEPVGKPAALAISEATT